MINVGGVKINRAGIFSALCMTLLLALACTKPSNIRWVYYNQTYCSDKWGAYSNNEDLKVKITEYCKSKNIDVYDIEIYSNGTADNCLDCTCKTGKRIKLKVKKRDLEDIKKEGFYE
ncbi:MAG TPA: hypothetical protein PLQ93_04855 [Bacteroidia bacterium]|nr:hypothetical protein [Bacteroidia bacterium]